MFKPLSLAIKTFVLNHPHNEHTGNAGSHPCKYSLQNVIDIHCSILFMFHISFTFS